MRCLFCNSGPHTGHALFRVNAKGEPGVWACSRHIKQTDAKPDQELRKLVAAIEERTEKAVNCARTDEQREREAFEKFLQEHNSDLNYDFSFSGGWTEEHHWRYNDYSTQSHWLCWRAATRRFA